MYEEQTFTNIINRMLDRVSDELDKREGSVIYDALAPAAMELSEAYIELDNVLSNTFATTCNRDFLIAYAQERGIEVKEAKPAVIKLLTTPSYLYVPLGSVFTIGLYNYTLTEQIAAGEYAATCNTPGVDGGSVTADMDIIPVVEINDLESVTFDSVITEGANEEDTESLRKRYIESLKPYSFGGNIADYKAKTLSIDGVGACHVMRAGDEISGQPIPGGYVNVIILDNAYNRASATLINRVQNILDPNPGYGEGLAPIGYCVTVSTTQYANVTVSLNIQASGVIDDTVIKGVIEDYFQSLRSSWDSTANGIIVRRSHVEEVVFSLEEVTDCELTELKITGATDTGHNLTLPITDIPKLDVLNVTPAN